MNKFIREEAEGIVYFWSLVVELHYFSTGKVAGVDRDFWVCQWVGGWEGCPTPILRISRVQSFQPTYWSHLEDLATCHRF